MAPMTQGRMNVLLCCITLVSTICAMRNSTWNDGDISSRNVALSHVLQQSPSSSSCFAACKRRTAARSTREGFRRAVDIGPALVDRSRCERRPGASFE